MSKTFPFTYINNKILPTKNAVIPIQAKAIQYGLGVFSGIRGHWNPKSKNLVIFRLPDHYERLINSAKIVGMKFDMSYKKFEDLMVKLCRKNKIKEDCYIRPLIYSASTKLTPRFDSGDDDLAIYMISLKNYFGSDKGLNIGVSSWRRIDDDAISVKAKITGSYANAALAKGEAVKHGYDECVFLNRDGKVCEAGSANIFIVKDGQILTPSLGDNNLNGITRDSLIEVAAKELNMQVKETAIDRSMLYIADEVFFCGTAAKISWVRTVDNRKVGSGKIGKITKKLSDIYEEVVRGNNPVFEKWSTNVY